MSHIIRLRGAWECTSSADVERHTRNFGRPRTLDPGERVWLVCQNMPGSTEVILNGKPIGANREKGIFQIDITDHLQTRNQVIFSVGSKEPLGEVYLEMRAN
jgi:hypothetical protein